MNVKLRRVQTRTQGKIWPFASTPNAPHFLLAPKHCLCKSFCSLASRKSLQQSSNHVRQRSKGPFRLWQRCQGHDGRQEGRQEEACVSVSSCRAAIPCRKDSQTIEGTTARSWSQTPQCSCAGAVVMGRLAFKSKALTELGLFCQAHQLRMPCCCRDV